MIVMQNIATITPLGFGICPFRRVHRHTDDTDNLPSHLIVSKIFDGGFGQPAHVLLPFIKLTITFTIISRSSGLLSAIKSVNATSALSVMRFSPLALYRNSWRCKNHTKIAAAIRLLPSVNVWFLTIK